MPRHPLYWLRFMKVRARGDNYYFLGRYDSNAERVFIPTLNTSFSYSEVDFGSDLTHELVKDSPVSNVISEEWDGEEFILVSRHPLSKREIKKIEEYYNNPSRGTPKVNKMFYK